VTGDDGSELSTKPSVRGPVLDEKALNAYKERLGEIDREMAEAGRNNDAGRSGQLREEKELLIEELRNSRALGNRARQFIDDGERARKAVSRAINDALKSINGHRPQLADHLRTRIERGASCCYKGDGIAWEV
jgi:hypothetical protein